MRRPWRNSSPARAEAHAAAAALRERALEKAPRLREIETALAGASYQVARAVLDGGDVDAEIERIKKENLALQAEMAALLREQGEQAADFEPVHTCSRCRDTGYADGKICTCLEQLLREAACRRLSRTSHMTLTRFEDMDLAYYPDDPDPRTGLSPRERMRSVIDYCRCYAADFVPGAQSLLLRGPTGTGEDPRFSCHCPPRRGKGILGRIRPGPAAASAAGKRAFRPDGRG